MKTAPSFPERTCRFTTLLGLAACLLATPAIAQPGPDASANGPGNDAAEQDQCMLLDAVEYFLPPPMTLRVYWENDGSFADPTDSYDRGYTNGFVVTADHQPDWAEHLAAYMPFADAFEQRHGDTRTAAGYVLGQLIFTPRSITTVAPIPGDRPYAGYLYGGVYWQRQADFHGRDDAAVLDHFELNLGVVGPSSLAEDIQTWVHDTYDGDTPRGWANQLDDEFAYQFYYRRKWRFDTGEMTLPFLGDVDTQVIPQVGVALGNVYRHAEASVTARFGFNLPDDFGAGRINDLRSATGDPALAHDGWAWFAWGRVGGRYVEHNTFLDGSNTQNPSPSIDKEPFVGEIQAGVAISYHDGPYTFEFTWGLTLQTDLFDAPAGSNADDVTASYGTMTFSFTKRF